MDEQQFRELSNKMDTIIKLLALNAVRGKQLKDQVSLLSSFGFQPRQIAEMLGKTPNHIRVILHGLRKKGQQQVEEVSERRTNQIKSESDV